LPAREGISEAERKDAADSEGAILLSELTGTPKTDVEKLQAAFEEFFSGIEKTKTESDKRGADVSARMIEIIAQGSTATAAYHIAIQLAKLNENIEKLRQTITVGNSLRSGDGYPEL
jgi:hypothetical protein